MCRHPQSAGPWPPAGEANPHGPLSATNSDTDSASDIENYYFGDVIGPKSEQVFRGVSCQLGGLPVDPCDPMHEELVQAMRLYDMDIVALQEIGINFNYTGVNGQWKNRLGWNTQLDGHRTKTINAYNSNDLNKATQQYGGTAIVARGDTTFWAAGSGKDPTHLGRWCWTRYQGANNSFLRIVSAYRPCANTTGQLSVYAQHKRYLLSQDDDRDPREAFLEDLQKEIRQWIATGDQIILCGDFNEDVLGANLTTYFEELGMHHLIFQRHDSSRAPPTYYNNTSGTAVDGVWSTIGLEPLRGGYLEKDDFPGDHRPIWFELSYTDAFGHTPPKIWKPQARRLQLRDPRCVKRYNKRYKKLILRNGLDHLQYALEASITSPCWTAQQRNQANRIDRLTQQCQEHAEKKCRKLRMGSIQFSDKTANPRRKARFWTMAIQRRTGRKRIRSRQWNRAKKKAAITHSIANMTLDEMRTALQQAQEAYKKARKDHIESRISFIEQFPVKH